MVKADASFFYALHILKDEELILNNIINIVNSKQHNLKESVTRTSTFVLQKSQLISSVESVKEFRENVQSHLLLQFTNHLILNDINKIYRNSLKESDRFIYDKDFFF